MCMNAMNDVMYCTNECPNARLWSHIQTLHSLRNDWILFAVYFSTAPLIFRCKLCIPLGTSFELLRLLFRRYKFCIPLGTPFELLLLIFRQYLALHSLRNCAPLGTTFCSFVALCIPLGTTFELLPVFSLSALDGARSDVTFYIIFGGFCSHGAELEKRNYKLWPH
jgi:hypothetical protein